jgi:hypothetical protein
MSFKLAGTIFSKNKVAFLIAFLSLAHFLTPEKKLLVILKRLLKLAVGTAQSQPHRNLSIILPQLCITKFILLH